MAKLTGEEKKKFLREKLEEQRHLLGKSVKEFTCGDLSDAVRIATIMRVLVHETGRCKPLLKEITPSYLELRILDHPPAKPPQPPPAGTQGTVIMSVPIGVKISADGVFLNPELAIDQLTPSILGKWWGRLSLILPGLGGFSRKEIVLGLADKEGGTHVDLDMTERYKKLLECKSFQIGWNNDGVTPLNLSRFMTGQAGLELLNCLDRNFPGGDQK